jgi:hypothetical protein
MVFHALAGDPFTMSVGVSSFFGSAAPVLIPAAAINNNNERIVSPPRP